MMIEMSFILISSYALFTLMRYGLSRLGANAPHRMLLRYSQALVLISLLAPVLLSFVPEKQLPEVHFQFRTYSEEFSSTLMKATSGVQHAWKQGNEIPDSEKNKRWLTQNFQESFVPVMWTLWALGFFFVLTQLALSLMRLKKILDHSTSFKKIGLLHLVVSDAVSVPFSARFFKIRWVVLPLSILERKSDIRIAIKHEFQHHRQGDTLWAVFIEILQCFFYFNPGIYLWKNTIVELQEFSCDEALTGQRGVSARDYGSCLVRVAEAALESREMHAGTACMAAVSKNPIAFKSLLKRRIEMIMQGKKSAQKLAGSFTGAIAILFTVGAAYAVEQSTRGQGDSIVAVDKEIQKIADQVIEQAIQREGAQAGFAIVADPNNGRILAIANVDKKSNRKGQWALMEALEPASLMKGIVAAEAIEMGVTTPTSEHNCENGVYHDGNQVFHDWKADGWNKLSTTEAVANSSDICALKIAEKLGSGKLRSMFSDYGFASVGSDSLIAPAAAYGMGFKSTPAEILKAYGALANGGNLLATQFSGSTDQAPRIIRRVLSEENSKKVRQILQQVVLTGTARQSPSKFYTTAGKTATSFSGGVMEGDSTGGVNKADIAGFIGFAPVAEPKVEIYVTIFSPSGSTGASGSKHAAPVFTELTDRVLKYMNVAPDKQKI